MNNKPTLESVLAKYFQMRDDRDWLQFHNPKNLAISLSLEEAEVLEYFQWTDLEESTRIGKVEQADIADELADVASYLFALAGVLGIDLIEAMDTKIDKTMQKYPIEKAKGNNTKYTKL